MVDDTTLPNQKIVLRKYRNRRYYDTTRSLHVTLEEIYNLVRAGHDIQVTDSQSGEDITPKVLAQIILEHDPLKLGIFPVELLHRVIRSNEPLMREFVDRYFNQFLRAYLDSQREFNRYLRQAMGLANPTVAGADWLRMVMWPLGQGPATNGGPHPEPAPRPEPAAGSEISQLQDQVRLLQEQIRAMDRRAGKK